MANGIYLEDYTKTAIWVYLCDKQQISILLPCLQYNVNLIRASL